jgi:glucosylceramidase
VLCASTTENIEAAGFVNPDGSAAVVALNRSEQTRRFALSIRGSRIVTELPPRSIATYVA